MRNPNQKTLFLPPNSILKKLLVRRRKKKKMLNLVLKINLKLQKDPQALTSKKTTDKEQRNINVNSVTKSLTSPRHWAVILAKLILTRAKIFKNKI